jgi:hypothetical protein
MSEGSITYVDEGVSCGIFTVINSQLRNHKVCDDNLACTEQYFDENQETTIKKCSSVQLAPGAVCNPLYRTCAGNIDCLRNENEEYTCGGVIVWDGNDAAINTNIIVTTTFQPNIALVVIGIILILVDILIYMYVFKYKKNRKKTVSYEKLSLSSDQTLF